MTAFTFEQWVQRIPTLVRHEVMHSHSPPLHVVCYATTSDNILFVYTIRMQRDLVLHVYILHLNHISQNILNSSQVPSLLFYDNYGHYIIPCSPWKRQKYKNSIKRNPIVIPLHPHIQVPDEQIWFGRYPFPHIALNIHREEEYLSPIHRIDKERFSPIRLHKYRIKENIRAYTWSLLDARRWFALHGI